MANTLVIKVNLPENYSEADVLEYGEHLQAMIPADFEQRDLNVGDVTFEIVNTE